MNEVEKKRYQAIGKKTCEALEKNGFEARYVETGAEALEYIASLVKPGMTVGFGGSQSVKAIGAHAKVAELGGKLLDHAAPGLTPEQKLETMRGQLTCDLFLASTNALTLEGELVNVDGNGNRLAALTFGPKKTVVIAGANKIAANREEAFARLELTASPQNNIRLGTPNPCVKSGYCMDCQGKTRICRVYGVLRMKPNLSDFTVVVVGEPLGY
jgi:L-lactate utilization protein LutB